MSQAPLYDTHFHLDPEDDAQTIYNDARAAGLDTMNLIACDLNDARRAQKLVPQFDGMYFSAGIHPHHVDSWNGSTDEFRPFLEDPRCKAVGEIGLDYYYHKEPEHKARQIEVFEAFLELSRELKLPAIIHCRDAFEDCLHSLEKILQGKQPFIVHCYTGDRHWGEKFLELGAYISYSGILTFKSAKELQDSVAIVPDDRLLIETDSPYLAPVPKRGKRNQPAWVSHVCTYLAELKGISYEECAELTRANGRRAFQLD